MDNERRHALQALGNPPLVGPHDCGILVARDDLLPGGTKARYMIRLFEANDEIVYASSPFGGAQLALASCALLLGKQATIFVPKRPNLHPRTAEALNLGATVVEIRNANLGKLQTQASRYCRRTGAKYLEFGGDTPEATQIIGSIASQVWKTHGPFDEVWSAAGSGVLTRGLQAGMLAERFFAVQVGRPIADPGRANIIRHVLPFEQEIRVVSPFPSDANYDLKAWQLCREQACGRVLFWNVMGPSPTGHLRQLSDQHGAGKLIKA